MTSSSLKIDPRKKRTRDELLAAFFKLVLSRRYHEIRIADILSGSGVSRSTFYEHFASKDELLCASIEGPFMILAGARNKLRIPRRLAAHALADGMFSPIVAWLLGEATCDAGDLALALQRSTTASVEAFLLGGSVRG
jgi:AcrR family transcriptional regulator